LLLDAKIIVSPALIAEQVKNQFVTSENITLLLTGMGLHWLIPIVEEGSEFVTSIIVFNAKTAERISSKDTLERLKNYRNSYSTYQWLEGTDVNRKVTEQLLESV